MRCGLPQEADLQPRGYPRGNPEDRQGTYESCKEINIIIGRTDHEETCFPVIGILYGRGVGDDKAGVIACLYALRALKAAGFEGESYYYKLDGCETYGFDGLNKENGLFVVEGNKFFDEQKPWVQAKEDIESFNNNIILHLVDREISVYCTLKDFSKNLPMNFLRCHKSYVVNMNHIKGFYRNFFTMKNGKSVPIPPKKYNSIIEEYTTYVNLL